MIFSELYSVYYNAVAKILSLAVKGKADEKALHQIISQYAFSESMLTILPSLREEKWQLLKSDMTTPLRHEPTMPLTTLEKRWLKSLSLDERIRLFDLPFEGLDDVEPLFTPDDYVIYDRYCDGDPYDSDEYIRIFRTVLEAVRRKHPLKICAYNRRGNVMVLNVLPSRLEYSEKDDKFRLIFTGCRHADTINLSRIISCCRPDEEIRLSCKPLPREKRTLTLRVRDERNALERAMLHFAHFEKQAERLDEKHYTMRINYDRADETEMVIRVLGFGPLVEVIEPQSFRELIIERLKKQKSCGLK